MAINFRGSRDEMAVLRAELNHQKLDNRKKAVKKVNTSSLLTKYL